MVCLLSWGVLSHRVEDDGGDVPLCMSAAAMPRKLLDTFDRLARSPDFRNAASIKLKRAEAFRTPLPWSADYIAQLSRHSVWRWVEPELPSWAKAFVRDRELFQRCGLSVEGAGTEPTHTWKVLYCVKNPPYMAVCPMKEVDVALWPRPANMGRVGVLGQTRRSSLQGDLCTHGNS